MSASAVSLILYFFVLVLALLGGGLLYYGARSLYLAFASTRWTSVPGEIVESYVQDQVSTSDDDNRHRTTTTYQAHLRFKYSVANVEYQCDHRVFGGEASYSDKAQAQAVCDRYPMSKAVTVYYDPKDPKDGVLEPGKFGGTLVWMIAGGIVLVVAYFMFRLALVTK